MVTNKSLGGMGQLTNFELQYVPEWDKLTEMGGFNKVAVGAKRIKSTASWQRVAVVLVAVSVIVWFCRSSPQTWQSLPRPVFSWMAQQSRVEDEINLSPSMLST